MSVGAAIVGGVGWTIAARWAIRGIGLGSTIILARLLVPQDFGIVAMATLATALIEVFTETGLTLYLIRSSKLERAHFDTVWSLRVIVGSCLGALIFLTAPFVADFFSEPRVAAVMQVLALKPVLGGLENPGMVLFRKNMQFSKDFQFLVTQKVVAFLITITLAVTLRNYWALVGGIIGGSIAGLLTSYLMHEYRPRWNLSRVREVWRFSAWMLGQHLLNFFNDRLDEFLVGRFKTAPLLGLYSVALDVGASPIREVTAPVSRVLFPAFSKIASDKTAIKSIFEKVFGAVVIIALALGPGLALVAGDFVSVVFGTKWDGMVPVLQFIALAAAAGAMSQPQISVLPALGREQLSVKLIASRVLLMAILMLWAAVHSDLAGIAAARLLALTIMSLFIVLVCAVRIPEMRIGLGVLWRPALACVVMAGVVNTVQEVSPTIPTLRLAISVIAGGSVYLVTIFTLWLLAGRPDSVESDLVSRMRAKISSAA